MESKLEKFYRFAEFVTDKHESAFFFFIEDKNMHNDKCYYILSEHHNEYIELSLNDMHDNSIYSFELNPELIATNEIYLQAYFDVMYDLIKINLLETECESFQYIKRNKKLLELS